MRQIVIATRSKGKFPEIVSILSGVPFELINLNDCPQIPKGFEVDEIGSSFESNAILKAMTIGTMTGKITIAEDSGLLVDALSGRPGVYTARYAPGTDKDRYMKLLSEMKYVPEEQRTARFIAVVALYDPQTHKVFLREGIQEGEITTEPIGENGFGYDPVFYSNDLGMTTAMTTLEEKNFVSHRGKAFREIKNLLLEVFN